MTAAAPDDELRTAGLGVHAASAANVYPHAHKQNNNNIKKGADYNS